jgi:hypothetical protein
MARFAADFIPLNGNDLFDMSGEMPPSLRVIMNVPNDVDAGLFRWTRGGDDIETKVRFENQDRLKQILIERYRDRCQKTLWGLRRNKSLGVIDVVHQWVEIDDGVIMSYNSLWGREHVTLIFSEPLVRKLVEAISGGLYMLVFYGGNQIAVIPMSSLPKPSVGQTRTLKSSWGLDTIQTCQAKVKGGLSYILTGVNIASDYSASLGDNYALVSADFSMKAITKSQVAVPTDGSSYGDPHLVSNDTAIYTPRDVFAPIKGGFTRTSTPAGDEGDTLWPVIITPDIDYVYSASFAYNGVIGFGASGLPSSLQTMLDAEKTLQESSIPSSGAWVEGWLAWVSKNGTNSVKVALDSAASTAGEGDSFEFLTFTISINGIKLPVCEEQISKSAKATNLLRLEVPTSNGYGCTGTVTTEDTGVAGDSGTPMQAYYRTLNGDGILSDWTAASVDPTYSRITTGTVSHPSSVAASIKIGDHSLSSTWSVRTPIHTAVSVWSMSLAATMAWTHNGFNPLQTQYMWTGSAFTTLGPPASKYDVYGADYFHPGSSVLIGSASLSAAASSSGCASAETGGLNGNIPGRTLLPLVFPYALNDQPWIIETKSAESGTDLYTNPIYTQDYEYIKLYTPNSKTIELKNVKSPDSGLTMRGWLNLSNGKDLIQGIEIGDNKFIFYGGDDMTSALVKALKLPDASSIQTIWIDMKLSDVNKLK